MTPSRAPKRTLLPGLALLSVLLAGALAGCSGSDGAGGGGDSGAAGSAPVAAEAPAPADGVRANADLAQSYGAGARNRVEPGPEVMSRAVIRKGDVELRADDVGKAQFDVRRVVGRYAGEVTEEKTTTDDDGKPAYTNMVLRIPTESFGDAMADLQGTEGTELVSANSSEDDVTTKLIDTQSRLAAQKRSIARITVLFDRAQSIRDIMAIESELSQRQADLDSLERQAAYLRGQTSMSTITVSIDETPARVVPKAEEDRSGFFAGLSAGWDALAAFAVGLATLLGALLPWLVVLGILGPPAYLLVRAIRRRISAGRSARTPSAA
ncbi:DUF4349 domain-containing protein [Nocardioides sp. URHA0032]|uniref:DUF4349 domain-containing protein n=1 Tax=Nocardioides sp. URHA0032 TaxID=1380388 RepID=UPI00048C2A9F|nr:DUF4349 domain-containing protein [Nocardioides sp. URHA0032]